MHDFAADLGQFGERLISPLDDVVHLALGHQHARAHFHELFVAGDLAEAGDLVVRRRRSHLELHLARVGAVLQLSVHTLFVCADAVGEDVAGLLENFVDQPDRHD